jgi:hypothetical protein
MFLIFINPSFSLTLLIFINIKKIIVVEIYFFMEILLKKLIDKGLNFLPNEMEIVLEIFLFKDHVFSGMGMRIGLGYFFVNLVMDFFFLKMIFAPQLVKCYLIIYLFLIFFYFLDSNEKYLHYNNFNQFMILNFKIKLNFLISIVIIMLSLMVLALF